MCLDNDDHVAFSSCLNRELCSPVHSALTFGAKRGCGLGPGLSISCFIGILVCCFKSINICVILSRRSSIRSILALYSGDMSTLCAWVLCFSWSFRSHDTLETLQLIQGEPLSHRILRERHQSHDRNAAGRGSTSARSTLTWSMSSGCLLDNRSDQPPDGQRGAEME